MTHCRPHHSLLWSWASGPNVKTVYDALCGKRAESAPQSYGSSERKATDVLGGSNLREARISLRYLGRNIS